MLAVDGPITRADIPALCERLGRLLSGTRADPVTVDVGECSAADLVTVEALARLQLTALRRGRRIRLGRADGDLRRLLAWTGLDEEVGAAAAPDPAGSAGVEPRGQAEQREQPGGVQERVDPGDPPP
ncbi:STAS domain-containing protein [Streptomyces macrosporus]|uniref:STAS domain-containing protein n=1 Tax=Streptomyces macrosporus TaxID=44032 RepID=UPI0031DE3DC3